MEQSAMNEDTIVCPYCGHRHKDLFDWGPSIWQDDTQSEQECEACEKTFKLIPHCAWEWSTYPKEEEL